MRRGRREKAAEAAEEAAVEAASVEVAEAAEAEVVAVAAVVEAAGDGIATAVTEVAGIAAGRLEPHHEFEFHRRACVEALLFVELRRASDIIGCDVQPEYAL
jgi:hypothetical protein